MPLIVHRSNRTERLVEVLADVVREPVPARLTAGETVVVQGRGMAHWVALELAQRLGIWANRDFPFPRAFVERVLEEASGDAAGAAEAFQPETLRWRVAAALPGCLRQGAFEAITHYLSDDPRGVKRLQLARLVADTFDQYLVYRPDLIERWERGEDADHWQAILWRRLVGSDPAPHIAQRAAELRRRGDDPVLADTLRERFPRLSVFAVSTLPPLYLDVFVRLGALVPVHLFVLSPSGEFWADLRSRREIARELRRRGRAGSAEAGADELHLDVGNPLLASMGRVGREFQELLEKAGNYVEGPTDLYEDEEGQSMLATVQADILHVRERGRTVPALDLGADDTSIRVHACHGQMREVEVLHDQLLALFDADATLAPEDVIVMCPDVDAYAPYVDAVFGGSADGLPSIPYRISDRRRRSTDPVAAAFLRLLDIVRARVTAAAVLDLLALDAIRDGTGIAVDDLDTIRGWVAEAGIRWGRDAADREAAGQPALAANTWQFGLDRLLLGYAMEGHGQRLYAGVLPVDDVEGAQAAVLGRLATFCESLFAWREKLGRPHTISEWQRELTALVDALLPGTNADAAACRSLREALMTVATRATNAGFTDAIELESIRAEIEGELDSDAPPHGFLTGALTVCALVPMRSIPFRVVCLLGMNDAAFPRSQRPPGFDVRAQAPRLGDRSAREDDRYLFLEALLCARERLLITYVGQSERDNAELPPSVVVSELLDVLGQSFRVPGAAAASDETVRVRVVLRQPLQPFSPRYFGATNEPELFSYSAAYCTGAAAVLGERRAAPPFVSAPLPLEESLEEVTLDELGRFFRRPVRTFLQRRLRLWLEEGEEVLEDREPIELDGLDRWGVGNLLLEHYESGGSVDDSLALLRASGRLPLGTPGDCDLRDAEPLAAAIHRTADTFRGRLVTPLLPVDLVVGAVRVTGVLRDVWATGQVVAQYSREGGGQEIDIWIRHLALCAVNHPGVERRTTVVARRDTTDPGLRVVRFEAPPDAAGLVADLVALYRVGLEQPLPVFEKASRAFAEHDGPNGPDPLVEARKEYVGNSFRGIPGDCDDPAVQRVFGTLDPLDGAVRVPDPGGGPELGFGELAVRVFGPLLVHRRTLRVDGDHQP